MIEHRFNAPQRYTFIQSMNSLFNTAKETLTAQLRGEAVFSTPELYEARLRVCETCPKRIAVGVIWKCGVCNCFLHLKAGTLHAVCPWYRWPGDERWKPANFNENLR
jgi:Family of unknown function (DUF6171)